MEMVVFPEETGDVGSDPVDHGGYFMGIPLLRNILIVFFESFDVQNSQPLGQP